MALRKVLKEGGRKVLMPSKESGIFQSLGNIFSFVLKSKVKKERGHGTMPHHLNTIEARRQQLKLDNPGISIFCVEQNVLWRNSRSKSKLKKRYASASYVFRTQENVRVKT